MASSGRDSDNKPLLDNGSFAGLLSGYGYVFPTDDAGWNGYGGSVSQNNFSVLLSPFYYSAAGWTSVGSGIIWIENRMGGYWGSDVVIGNLGGAHYLHFANNVVYPARWTERWQGMSLRCLDGIVLKNGPMGLILRI